MSLLDRIGELFDAVLMRFLRRFLRKPEDCEHAWIVYCVATRQRCLELYCNQCFVAGAVFDPTEEEWRKALGAPSNPYSWSQKGRVTIGKGRVI